MKNPFAKVIKLFEKLSPLTVNRSGDVFNIMSQYVALQVPAHLYGEFFVGHSFRFQVLNEGETVQYNAKNVMQRKESFPISIFMDYGAGTAEILPITYHFSKNGKEITARVIKAAGLFVLCQNIYIDPVLSIGEAFTVKAVNERSMVRFDSENMKAIVMPVLDNSYRLKELLK